MERFTDVTQQAGVRNGLYATSAAWADYDNDAGWTCSSPITLISPWTTRSSAAICVPTAAPTATRTPTPGSPTRSTTTRGTAAFKEVSRRSGIWDPGGKGLGVVWFDYDLDGDEDLYVANDATPNRLYRNDSNGRFTDVTCSPGSVCSEDGKPQSGMGVDAGDLDATAAGLFVTNLTHETNEFYRNLGGKGPFLHDTYPAGLARSVS